jgi:ParB family transcriptional regulator, chromosome partitioning protein
LSTCYGKAKTFPEESIVQLADSLKARGQLVPTLVRWSESEDSYILVDGERRYRAAMKAGLDTMTCVVTGDASPEDLLEVQLVTNALREDVPPVEQGRAYQAIIEAKGYSHRELADRLNVSHPTITRALGLLDLPVSVQAMVDDGKLSPSTAHAIMTNVEDPADQEKVAAQAVDEKLSRARAVDVAREVAGKTAKGKGSGASSKPVAKLPTERTIRTSTGHKVTVAARKGFDGATLVPALREALATAEGELAPADEDAA